MAAMPYIVMSFLMLILIFFLPVIATWLPGALTR